MLALQGAHQVAQKSSTTTLPRRLARSKRPPERSGRARGGAGWLAFFEALPEASAQEVQAAKIWLKKHP